MLTGTGAILTPKTYPATYDLIPGFQLIDNNFVLRADSTGHRPRDHLFDTLLPMVRRLVAE